jgi:hypothetical protein
LAREDLEAERALRREAEAQREMAIAGRKQAQVRHSQVSSPEQPANAAEQPRRRGRPPKLVPEQSEFVEWWVPGWKEKYDSRRPHIVSDSTKENPKSKGILVAQHDHRSYHNNADIKCQRRVV